MNNRKKAIVLVLLLSLPVSARAAGIKVYPSEIRLNLDDAAAETAFEVTNPTAETELVRISSDGQGIRFSPATLSLPPAGTAAVTAIVYPGSRCPGSCRITVRIAAEGPGSMIGAGAEIVISVSRKKKFGWKDAAIAALVLSCCGLWITWVDRKKSSV
ncbi:MAG: hypothetical protein ACM3NH_00340 [Candidatus Saccharibacteria bacterium]